MSQTYPEFVEFSDAFSFILSDTRKNIQKYSRKKSQASLLRKRRRDNNK